MYDFVKISKDFLLSSTAEITLFKIESILSISIFCKLFEFLIILLNLFRSSSSFLLFASSEDCLLAYDSFVCSDKNPLTLSVTVDAVVVFFKKIAGVDWDAASIWTIEEASYIDGNKNKSAL